jgi:hypothetical protein
MALAQRIEALRHELPEDPGRRRLTHASGRGQKKREDENAIPGKQKRGKRMQEM